MSQGGEHCSWSKVELGFSAPCKNVKYASVGWLKVCLFTVSCVIPGFPLCNECMHSKLTCWPRCTSSTRISLCAYINASVIIKVECWQPPPPPPTFPFKSNPTILSHNHETNQDQITMRPKSMRNLHQKEWDKSTPKRMRQIYTKKQQQETNRHQKAGDKSTPKSNSKSA